MAGGAFEKLGQPFRRFVRSRHLGMVGFMAAGACAAFVLFLIGTWVRLLFGPISLGSAVDALSGALTDALPPGITMAYDEAAVEWSKDEQKVNLVVRGIRMFDRSGRTIVSAPKADIDLAALPLLHGEVAVRRITLIGVMLTLTRTADGNLRFGIGKNRIDEDILSQFARTLSSAQGSSSLNTLAVHEAKVAFADEITGLYVVAPEADLRLKSADGSRLHAVIDADIRVGDQKGGQTAHLKGAADFSAHGKRISGKLKLGGLVLSALLPDAAKTKDLAVPLKDPLKLDIAGDFVLDENGVRTIRADLAGAGNIRLPFVNRAVPITRLRASGRYDGDTGRIVVLSAEVSGEIRGSLQGRVDLSRAGGGMGGHIAAEVTAAALSLDVPEWFSPEVDLSGLKLQAAWDGESRQLTVDSLRFDTPAFAFSSSGNLTFPRGMSPGVSFVGTLGTMGVRDLVHFWPHFAARGGRAWVDARMPAGSVGPARFSVQIPPGGLDVPLAADAVDVSFPIFDAEAEYIVGLPHLTGGFGSARLTGRDFTVRVDGADIGPLRLSGGRFYIPDVTADTPTSAIAAHLTGSVPNVLRLIDHKPLGYPSRFGIDPAKTAGAADTDVRLSVPLIHDVGIDRIGISVHTQTSGLGLRLGSQLHLTGGTVAFDVSNTQLHAEGLTGLGGSRARLQMSWDEDFRPRRRDSTQISFTGTLDEAARSSLGMPRFLTVKGPVKANGRIVGTGGALSQGAIDFDLTPAMVVADAVSISKPAGFPLQGHADLTFAPGSVPATAELKLTGPDARISAALRFDARGTLTALQMPTFQYGSRNAFSLVLTRGTATDIVLRGKALDVSHLLGRMDSVTGGAEGAREPATAAGHVTHVLARLDRVHLREDVAVEALNLDMREQGERLAAFHASGKLGKADISGTLTDDLAGRTLSLQAGDTGMLLKGLFGFSSLRGGTLALKTFLPGTSTTSASDANAPDYRGTLTVAKFRVVDQPFLARLFSAGSLGGLINLMEGEGIVVDELSSSFTARNHVLSVQKTHAVGPAIGVTAEGYVDLGKDAIALKGTLVPLYGLNSVLGNIPLIGNVLTSKKGEGIFGMSYSVEGNAGEPVIRVNPLSVLAPGFLRRLFEGKIPDATQAPSNNPDKSLEKKKK